MVQEAENAARQNALSEKSWQIEHLETVKEMNAAKAHMQVYEEDVGSDEEMLDWIRDWKPMQDDRHIFQEVFQSFM